MRVSVGIDIAKEVHWITAIDECGEIRLDHRLDNAPAAIEALIGELRALEGDITVGLGVVGGIAGPIWSHAPRPCSRQPACAWSMYRAWR
jgi:hypothetical protein